MCICAVLLHGHPEFPFVLVHNRDEAWDRETEETKEHDGGLVFARDGEAGGACLGVNVISGAIAALTNTRSNVPRPKGKAEPSRGQLVLHALEHPDAPDGGDYSAFSLFHGIAAGEDPKLLRDGPRFAFVLRG
ncbi:unnamed protein product [Symbiodinium sp. KB8]|nr:unnamed protein product [Symbiodinium sp. KB8]